MTVTVVTRWATPDVAASMKAARQSKAVWLKHGATDFRLSQIFTGQFTGQWVVSVTFADMVSYAKGQSAANSSAEMQKIRAANEKLGAVLQERIILVGTDL